MMIDCNGTIIAATTMRKMTPLPPNLSLAKAKPAVVLTARMITIATTQISVELRSSRATGRSWKSCPQLLTEWPICRSNCVAVRNALLSM